MQTRMALGAAVLAMALGTAQEIAWSQAGATASQEELLFWETIKGSSNPADFQEYLKQYPSGRFAGLARIRLRSTAPAATSAAPPSAAAKTIAPAASGTAGLALPQKGDAWAYRFLDRKYGRKQERFSVRIDEVSEDTITESMSVEGAPGAPRRVDLRKPQFFSQPLLAGRTLLDFAPYATMVDGIHPPYKIRFGSGYPIGVANAGDWQVTVARTAEPIVVPAGRFQAQRFVFKGVRNPPYILDPATFEVRAWYAPEAKRYVRLEHRMWIRASSLLADELVELLEFSRGGRE
jgi:hypothetical protein